MVRLQGWHTLAGRKKAVCIVICVAPTTFMWHSSYMLTWKHVARFTSSRHAPTMTRARWYKRPALRAGVTLAGSMYLSHRLSGRSTAGWPTGPPGTGVIAGTRLERTERIKINADGVLAVLIIFQKITVLAAVLHHDFSSDGIFGIPGFAVGIFGRG